MSYTYIQFLTVTHAGYNALKWREGNVMNVAWKMEYLLKQASSSVSQCSACE